MESITRLRHHEEWRRKDKINGVPTSRKRRSFNEQSKFEQNMKTTVKIITFNIDLLGRNQQAARNFWVNLSEEMSIEEIRRRINIAFGNQEENHESSKPLPVSEKTE